MSKIVVPKKNYYILILMLIGIVVLTFSIVSIVNGIKNSNVSSGYINRYVSKISYDEIDNYLIEPASNAFIYITYTGDKTIYKLEKEIKKLINNYDLASNFIYVDVTKKMLDNDFLNQLNNKLNVEKKINKLPVILYYRDGILTDMVERDANIFNVADFQKLLDNYEITN